MSSPNRWDRIEAFAREAWTALDMFKLGIAGFARSRPFDSPGLISGVGRMLFRRLVLHPKLLGGMAVELDPTDLGDLISFEEVFVEKTYDLSRVPFTPDTIVDCGAHAGYFTLLAAKKFPSAVIYAFEPFPRNVKMLRRQADRNGLAFRVLEAAASLADGEGWFAAENSNTGSLLAGPPADGRGLCVRMMDFPAWLARLGSRSLVLKL
ncbi:MAG TPA: FkbM family methyltransferase, partial [Sphingomonadales bacterium]|nr:FkbM family methyltransferase [Sphingomonadales bacterium]